MGGGWRWRWLGAGELGSRGAVRELAVGQADRATANSGSHTAQLFLWTAMLAMDPRGGGPPGLDGGGSGPPGASSQPANQEDYIEDRDCSGEGKGEGRGKTVEPVLAGGRGVILAHSDTPYDNPALRLQLSVEGVIGRGEREEGEEREEANGWLAVQ